MTMEFYLTVTILMKSIEQLFLVAKEEEELSAIVRMCENYNFF